MLGIAGSHRSGKSTLARELADRLGIEFLETKVGNVFADLGIDPKAPLPFDKRLEVQNAILRHIEAQYMAQAGKPFIADRTPFCVTGYTMADVQRDTLDDAGRRKVMAHMLAAGQIAGEYLNGVMLLRPLPNPPEATTSAPACPFYMRHHYLLVKDFLECYESPHNRGFMCAELTSLDRDERIEDGEEFCKAILNTYGERQVKIWTPNS